MSKHNPQWQSVELGSIIDIFDSIRVPLNSQQRSERQGKYPYYGASGIIDSIDDYLFDGEYILVAEDGENLNSRKLPVAFMARGQFWVNNHAHIIKGKRNVADDRFVIAWFAQADIKGYITGAAQPKLSQANLKRIALSLPPYSTQNKIASILSAYDDLIENNTRRIAILEAMAQAIYREWFVEFRFPGHEKVKLVDSPLGKIPEGWVATVWGELASLEYGKALRGYEGKHEQYLVFGTNGPIGWHEKPLCHTPGIVIGRKGAYRGVHFSDAPFWVIDTAFYLKPKTSELDIVWAFYNLLHVDINSIDSGSAIPSTSRDAFYAIPVISPKREVTTRFRSVVDDLRSKCTVLNKKNANLRNTRDLLLPKLISGQLDVENLDIESSEPLVEVVA